MALQEFTGKLDETPKLKEFTGNLDGTSSTLGEVTAAIKSIFAPKPASVMEGLPADPAAFDFNKASRLQRQLDDEAQRRKDFGTIGPIVGPKPSTMSVINGLFTDLVAGGKGTRAGINQIAGDLTGSEYLLDKARRERGQADLMTAVNTPEFESETAKGVYGGVSSLVRNAIPTAAAIVTRNPNVALGGMVAPMVPDEYSKFRQRGAAPGEALLGATGTAGIEYLTEKTPMGFLVQNFGKAGAAKIVSGFIAKDFLPEQVATITQDAIDTAIANPDKTWGQYLAERPSAAYQTGVATVTQAGLMGGANAAARRLTGQQEPAQAPAQPTAPTSADYQALVNKVFGNGQAPAAPAQQAPVSGQQAPQIAPAVPAPQAAEQTPQQPAQALAQLIANTATQESPLNTPKLTPVADDIQLDKEPVADGTANVLQPVDSTTTGSVAPDTDASVAAPQRVRDAGQLDLTGNGTTEPAVRTAPLATDGQLPQQDAPANAQPVADVTAPVTQPATLVATEAGAGGAQPSQAAPTTKPTGYIGQDGTSIDEGGTPFKTKQAAQKAKKLQPMMRVKQVEGGFVLADKTPAQLAAEAKAAKRISGANAEAGSKGKPMAAHEFIASRGGMAPSERSDLGIEGNVKIGNRWLFAGAGKGMTIAQATEALQEAGYLNEDSHNAAYDLIKRSVSNPQYTYEGWDRIAELEMQTQFEDYLASQQEAAQEDNFDPFAPLDDAGFTQEDADAAGFGQASPELQAEVAALAAQLDAQGMDAEGIMERIAVQYPQATQDEYYEHAKDAITQAIAEAAKPASSRNAGQDGGQQSTTPEASAEQADQGLTSYTPQDIEDRLAKLEKAEQERKRQEQEAEQKAKADAERDTFTLTGSDRAADVAASQGQQDIFSTPVTPEELKQIGQERFDAQVKDAEQRKGAIDDMTAVASDYLDGKLEVTPAKPSEAATQKRKSKESAFRAKLEDHFAVGNIIKSDYWGTHSRVTAFDWNDGNWSVTQEKVEQKDGEWVAVEGPRSHSTAPSKKDVVVERAEQQAPATEAKTDTQKITDFGEKIGGARKDVWTSFKDQLNEVEDGDIASQPLSKVWPLPDYQAMIDGGTDPWAVAFVRAARDEIPAKPRAPYKVKRWAGQVQSLRSMANDVMAEDPTAREKAKELFNSSTILKPLRGRVELYMEVGHSKSLEGITFENNFYSLYRGEQNVSKWVISQRTSSSFGNWPREFVATDTKEEAIAKFKEMHAALGSKSDAKKQTSFDIYSKLKVKGYFVGKKVGRNYIDLAGPFDTVKEARTYKNDSQDELVAKLEKAKEIPMERRNINDPRVGEDMRHGQDVTPQEFGQAFGFRGVEFGNWVEQGRRQQDLNDAYDALMDMAALLDIPPKAISLNGELGLAFGARGGGGVNPAAAHYERDKVVINLTKKNGAGSLGHEWWHALDSYFSRQRKKPDGMMTDATDVKLASRDSKYFYEDKGVRQEMIVAFGRVMKSINTTAMKARSSVLDGKRSKEYWTTDVEMSARAFESYLISKLHDQNASNDYLANIASEDTWNAMAALGIELDNSYPYPTAGEIPEIRAGFDAFFNAIEHRESDKGIELYEPEAQYNVDAPKTKYTDDKQLQLFLDNGPDQSQAGTRGEVAQRAAVAAVDDLRRTETLLGLALSSDYSARQRATLVGQTVSSTEDLATLAQVYRDPRFETFRVVFVNDSGNVVSQVGLTSRLPASTQAIMGNDADSYLASISATARNRGATGYYLLHNHPSGEPAPSRADIRLTQHFAETIKDLEFKSHVVIDTNKYTTIGKTGLTDFFYKNFGQPEPFTAQEWADVKIGGPADVMSMTKRLEVDRDSVTLIHTDAQFKVKAISTIPVKVAIGGDSKKAIIKASLKTQGSQVFAVSTSPIALKKIAPHIRDGILVRDDGSVRSLAESGELGGGEPFPASRRTRLSPDTSPEFGYLRNFGQEAELKVAELGKEYGGDQQTELDLNVPGVKLEPVSAKDAFSLDTNAAGRKEWTLGRKLYDNMATVATEYLGRVKMADNRPAEFKQMMRQFRVDQNKATESAKAIAEKGMELTPEQRVLLSDLIEKQGMVGDVPPQEMVELAASITAALETQARDLIELGMLSEDRLVKDYLPRLYKTPLVASLTNKQMFMSWFTKTRMKIRGARLQSRGLVNEVPIEKVELAKKFGWKVSSLADGDNLPQNLLDVLESGGKIPAKFKGTKVVMWRDFTESERQDMGEVRDAVLRYAMGYVETQRDVAIGRLFKAVATNPDLAKTFNPGGWVQVPNTEIKGAPGTKTYGALAGMYVEPQVADSLKRNTQPKGVLMAAYDKALGWWKEGKTVWNPVSHGNNVVSNVFVMHFAGLNPANPANWRNTVREYRTKGQYYQEAVDKGLFGTEWATMEIQNLLMPDLADMADIESVATSRVSKVAEFLKKTGKPVSWYRENMQRAYEFEDQFFKLMIYADRRKAGMTPEQAIEDTERYIFNYADLPEGVENIKRVYSPFFSYTYKAVPMVIHTAMTRPDRLLVPIALLSGANWLGYLISGGDEDKERKGLPDYMQGRSAIGTQKAIRMPFDVEGKPAFMDVTRRVPLGDLFDTNNQANGLPVPAPLMPSHPLLSMTAAIAWNVDTFSGKDLVKKSDTAWEAAKTRAGYVYKQLTPNAPFVPGSYNFNKLMDSAAYSFDTEIGPYTGRTKAGDPIPLSTTLPDVFTGTKIRAVDPERGIEYKRADIAKEVREIQSNIRSANRNQSMTSDSRERYNQEQRDKLDELKKQREALQ